jgi:hypothetical protein
MTTHLYKKLGDVENTGQYTDIKEMMEWIVKEIFP